jgi:excisionase family DNA binding protein
MPTQFLGHSLLGVPAPYIYALARRGAIPVVRVGERYVRFRAEAIAAWIESRESPARRVI